MEIAFFLVAILICAGGVVLIIGVLCVPFYLWAMYSDSMTADQRAQDLREMQEALDDIKAMLAQQTVPRRIPFPDAVGQRCPVQSPSARRLN